MAVAVSGTVAAAIDLRTRRIPNVATLGITAAGLVMAATHVSGRTMATALIGFGVGFLLMLPGHVIGATGAGDVKLFAALGTLIGPVGMFTAFVYTALAGGVLALAVAVRRRRLGETVDRMTELVKTRGATAGEIESPSVDNRFAYAPAIAVGALAAALGL